MITIDKLCYTSRLRYENAAEKFAFAVITLIICVMSRSMVIAGIVLAVTGILTVWKGGIPLFRSLHFFESNPRFPVQILHTALVFHLES